MPTKFHLLLGRLAALGLPAGEFAVVGSGPLSARGIRDSADLDVIVTEQLWNRLAAEHPVGANAFGVEHIELGADIEILNPTQSIFGNSAIVPFREVLAQVDTFNGISFICLAHLRKIKSALGREKDLADIDLIDRHLAGPVEAAGD